MNLLYVKCEMLNTEFSVLLVRIGLSKWQVYMETFSLYLINFTGTVLLHFRQATQMFVNH